MKTRLTNLAIVLFLDVSVASTFGAEAQVDASAGQASADQMVDIAKKLANPVASLISVPVQSNFDFGGGPNDDGFQYRLTVQPIIPFELGENWNLITRTIVPYIYQEDRIGTSSQSGLGDSTLSLFFTPKNPGPGGLIWAIGPEF